MAEDSEKRFHQIMDKLFHSPNSPPSRSPATQPSESRKRPNPSSTLALVDPNRRVGISNVSQHSSSLVQSSQAPVCRPWDRGDLMRRLATFKSMTWFAKPKSASAVNCARRGWVNVDMDIIACEACGARLLFSTPSSWTRQQVEKAASVFSLKLDNGHKLLCPWGDNSCDEMLTEFPPTTALDLVDKFKERFSALLQLSALPKISASAVDFMRSPELEEFLKQPAILESGDSSANLFQSDFLGNEAKSANFYYQAQKLISLCGWETRLLPYVVTSDGKSNKLVKDANVLNSSQDILNEQNLSISPYSDNSNIIMEEHPTAQIGVLHSDPKSIVLDCRLCGASVGLWAFSTIPQPLELFRVVGYTEVNGENKFLDSGTEHRGENSNGFGTPVLGSKEKLPSFNLTIAGGPPPTKQDFKATISLPVIGRSLRNRICFDSEFRDRTCNSIDNTCPELKHKKLSQGEKYGGEYNISGQIVQSDDTRPLESQSDDQRLFTASEEKASEKGDTIRKDKENCKSLGETNISAEGTSGSGRPDSSIELVIDIAQNVNQGSTLGDKEPENIEHVGFSSLTGDDLGRNASVTSLDTTVTTKNGDANQTSPGDNGQEGITDGMQTRENGNVKVSVAVNERKQLASDNAMEFDPIRQHRHFCPWIASTGSRVAGWRQTLSALQRLKEFSYASTTDSPPPTSLIKVDDPITSVRNLFMSPSAKRKKMSGGSI